VASFIPTVGGTYSFSLKLMPGGSTAATTVTVYESLPGLVRDKCYNCHSAAGIGVATNVFGNWSSSGHKAKGVVCSQCHVGADTGGHPGVIRSGSVSTTTFNYAGSAGSGNFCVTCHNPAIVTEFAASKHSTRAGSASCSFCHVGGVHNPNAACVDCHNPGSPYGLPWPPTGLEFHNDYSGTNLCANCHNRHNPKVVTGMSGAAHYNNITSAGYPASYVTSKAVCANCHVSNETNTAVRHQWAKSGHAAFTDLPWTEYDFKTRSGCVLCHTTTGFISYSTGRVTAAWGVASDKTKEVLACNGCHSNVENGVVRTVSPIKPFAADTYVNRNIGPSNICMNCHSGRNNGLSITSDDFTNQVFIAPHYLAAGSILHGKGGYNFPGQPYAYYSSNSHRVIGIGNSSGTGTAGPCIGCHMTASRKHLFKAVSSVTGGLVGKITTNTCANCHGSSFINDPTNINNSQLAYKNSLEVLNQTLIYRNFPYSVDYPYFSNTNWGTGQSGANTMGAAFNYVLLKKEPGGYAHNPGYAKKLIFDSIDYLYNGSITGSIEGALAYLVQNNKISQSIADGVSGYKAAGSCTSCHINSSGSHTSHLNSGFGCAECHSSTAATNTTLVPGTTTHANGVTNLAAGPGRTFSYSGGTCSNISCHSNNSAVWGGTVGCGGCHAIPPRTGAHLVHTDGVGAVYGSDADNSVASTYRFNCGSCHPMSISSHANGVVDLELFNSAATGTKRSNPSNAGRTGSGNSTVCLNVYCHSSGQNAEVRTYTNTPQWGGTFAGNRCAGCHGDPPGYGNGGAGSSSANSHYGTRWTTSGPVESGHLVGLHFDNIRRDPPDEYNPFIAQGGGPSSGAAHGDSETSTTISCNSCHSATVSVASQMSAPGSAFDCMRCHTNPAAGIIADKSRHVNGVRDVVFMTGTFKSKAQIKLTNFTSVIAPLGWTRNNGFKAANSFDSVPFSGSYNSELKSCTTACHLNQPVRWGDESNGCFSCHADL
jgi:predicted CxxxxCH...CXXCH cytochrome family protein